MNPIYVFVYAIQGFPSIYINYDSYLEGTLLDFVLIGQCVHNDDLTVVGEGGYIPDNM